MIRAGFKGRPRTMILALLSVAGAHGSPDLAGAASLFGLTADGRTIVHFDSVTPQRILGAAAITGLRLGERIAGIDVTPLTGELYGVGIAPGATDTGRLYRINPSTGVASQIGTDPFATDLRTAVAYGVDFAPFGSELRIVSSAGENLRVNPGTGARNDSPMNDGDLNPGAPDVTAVAYAYVNIPVGRLFGIDTTTDQLVTIGALDGSSSPDTGGVFPIGPLGVDAVGDAGLTVDEAGIPFAALTVGAQNGLYTINPATGVATLVGPIGDGNLAIGGLAADRSVADITISPPSGTYATTQSFDLQIFLSATNLTMAFGSVTFDGIAVTTALAGCIRGTRVPDGRLALRCPGLTGALLGPGAHTLTVEIVFAFRVGLPSRRATASVTWTVVETTEP